MSPRRVILMFVAAISIAALVQSSALPASSGASPEAASAAQAAAQFQPPTDEEVRARTQAIIAHQHADDLAMEQYERIEHQVDRTGGASSRTLADKTYRVVPNGMGVMKILLKDSGKPVDPAEIIRQMQLWQQTLELALRPNDPKYKSAYAKYEKRKHDRAELIDGTRESYSVKWVGREVRNGRDCDVVELTPNPAFHPHTTVQEVLTRTTAKIWVDHQADRLVHGEAHVTHDVSFGGGVLGKLYRGAVFSLDQTEVAPGIWLPSRYQYDFSARKFLFPFEEHQYIEVSHYRYLGSPKQALAVVQGELSSGKILSGDP